jgi:UTP:GlnB (protein PII) uridylyltransferase
MNMIYKDDTLFVDLVGEVGMKEINMMKERVFSVLNQYEVDNVVINVKNTFRLNRNVMNTFIDEYHKNYKGNILIDNK